MPFGMYPPPIPGRVVAFYPGELFNGAHFDTAAPLAATIAHVWGPSSVNLMVIDSAGVPHGECSVVFVEDYGGREPREFGRHASWPPSIHALVAADRAMLQKHPKPAAESPAETTEPAAAPVAAADAVSPAAAPAAAEQNQPDQTASDPSP